MKPAPPVTSVVRSATGLRSAPSEAPMSMSALAMPCSYRRSLIVFSFLPAHRAERDGAAGRVFLVGARESAKPSSTHSASP